MIAIIKNWPKGLFLLGAKIVVSGFQKKNIINR